MIILEFEPAKITPAQVTPAQVTPVQVQPTDKGISQQNKEWESQAKAAQAPPEQSSLNEEEPENNRPNYDIRAKVIAHMRKKKWVFLGQGSFAVAFINPEKNKVIKIIAPEGPATDLAKSLKSKSEFAQYKWQSFVAKNPNIHYPKFYKSKVEIIKEGNIEIKIELFEMELLTRIDDPFPITIIGRYFESPKEGNLYDNIWERYQKVVKDPLDKEKFINKYGGLIKALEKVVEVGDQYNFYNDLHSGNFMQREDGTIVIIDPWAFS